MDCPRQSGGPKRVGTPKKKELLGVIKERLMGMKLYEIGPILEECLHKIVDLYTHRQLLHGEAFLSEVLIDGIKIYLRKSIFSIVQ